MSSSCGAAVALVLQQTHHCRQRPHQPYYRYYPSSWWPPIQSFLLTDHHGADKIIFCRNKKRRSPNIDIHSTVKYNNNKREPPRRGMKSAKRGSAQRYEIPNEVPFPLRLHIMLQQTEASGQAHIVSWMPSGKAFRVHDREEFSKQVLPEYFRSTNFRSFQRNLSVYQFARIWNGPEKGAYYHEHFLRQDRKLCTHMKRHVAPKKETPLPHPSSSSSCRQPGRGDDSSKTAAGAGRTSPEAQKDGHLQDEHEEGGHTSAATPPLLTSNILDSRNRSTNYQYSALRTSSSRTSTPRGTVAGIVDQDKDRKRRTAPGCSPDPAPSSTDSNQVIKAGLTAAMDNHQEKQPHTESTHRTPPPKLQKKHTHTSTARPPHFSSVPGMTSPGQGGATMCFGSPPSNLASFFSPTGFIPSTGTTAAAAGTLLTGSGYHQDFQKPYFSVGFSNQQVPQNPTRLQQQQPLISFSDGTPMSPGPQTFEDDDPFLLDRLWLQTLNMTTSSKNPMVTIRPSSFCHDHVVGPGSLSISAPIRPSFSDMKPVPPNSVLSMVDTETTRLTVATRPSNTSSLTLNAIATSPHFEDKSMEYDGHDEETIQQMSVNSQLNIGSFGMSDLDVNFRYSGENHQHLLQGDVDSIPAPSDGGTKRMVGSSVDDTSDSNNSCRSSSSKNNNNDDEDDRNTNNLSSFQDLW